MRISQAAAVSLAAVLAVQPAVWADSYFVAVGWRGEFARIDAATLEVHEMSNVLPHELQAIDLTPDGVLLAGPGANRDLYMVDPDTGTAELFLSIDSDIRGMAFSPTGALYITARDESVEPALLRTLSLADGSYADVGPLDGSGLQPQGLAFSPDGVLYAVCPMEETFQLYTIDPGNAEVHLVGSHEGDLHQGLAFAPDGSLYAVGPSVFAQLDPTTGAVIGETIALSGDYRGLAYVPEPGSALLLLSGGLVLMLRQGRRNTR